MGFGKLRRVWESMKNGAKKVWGGIKKVGKTVMPAAKTFAPAIANSFVPGSGALVSAGLGVADQELDGDFKGAASGAAGLAKIRLPSWSKG
jgi:hypothetical protein